MNLDNFLFKLLDAIDEEELVLSTDRMRESDYYNEWENENEMLAYLHRWLVKKHNLPVAIRAKMVHWIREDKVLSKFLEPLALALEKNDRNFLKKEEISI